MTGLEKYLWFGMSQMCLNILVKNQMIEEGLADKDFNSQLIERQHDIYELSGGKKSIEELTQKINTDNWTDVQDELIAEIKAIAEVKDESVSENS